MLMREREAEKERGKEGVGQGEGERDLWQLKTRMTVIGVLIKKKKKPEER